MKRGSNVKAIYRLAGGAWIGWALCALMALLSAGSGNSQKLALSVLFSILYAILGVYVLLEGRAGLEAAVSGGFAVSARTAHFVYASAPLASALAVTAGIICWVAGRIGNKSVDIFYTLFNVAPAVATLRGLMSARRFPAASAEQNNNPKRLLRAPDFYIALVLLGICVTCFVALVATRTRVEQTRTFRNIALDAGSLAFLTYLVLLFRPAAYHLARAPWEVMDRGDRPPLWLRTLLIYTAQSGVICAAFNGFIAVVSGVAHGDLHTVLLVVSTTGMAEALFISACIVVTRLVRGDPLPYPKARDNAPPRAPNAPAKEDPKPPANMSANERRRHLYDRAKALERESASGTSAAPAPEDPTHIAVPASGMSAGRTGAPAEESPASAPLTPAERAQRRALEAALISVIRRYHDRCERQRKNAPAKLGTTSARADMSGQKAAASTRETMRDGAVRNRADGQKRLRALRAAELEKESAAVARTGASGTSREELERLVRLAAARLEPNGAALGTARGQRALFGDLAALLPGMEALDAEAVLSTADRKDGAGLPEAVGRLLERVCDTLIRLDPDEAISRWEALSPEGLARGWRALKIYGEISTAGAMFDAVASRLTDYMHTRPDCEAWLRAYAGEGGQ